MKWNGLVLCFFFFALVPNLRAEEAPVCDGQGNCSIVRGVQTDGGQIQQMSYTFKYRPAKNGFPTVVFIPGGPGLGSTQRNPSEIGGIPEDFGVILTDPRFVGVNKIETASEFKSAMNSNAVADDLLAAVKAVGAKNYVLYGVSYGTVPASIAAAHAGTNQPMAVVLEGTVGRAVKQAEYEQGFYQQWNSFVKGFDSSLFQLFQNRVKMLISIGQFTSEDFGTLIQVLLMSRHAQDGTDNLKAYVGFIATGPIDEVKTALKTLLGQVNAAQTGNGTQLFHSIINCKEMFPDGHPDSADFSFDGMTAELKPGGRADCRKVVSPTDIHAYDSRNSQIHAPIFYIQGADDPATPRWQAVYHYENQNESRRKYFVSAPDGSHAPLDKELKACSTNFWLSLARNTENAIRTFSPCLTNNVNPSAPVPSSAVR